MALMAAAGEITPMPVAAIFADTQAEPESVYVWLEWLKTQLPFPVQWITKGDLRKDSLRFRERQKASATYVTGYSKSLIPAYVLNKNGTRGIMKRSCTHDYKMIPIIREAKRLIREHRAEFGIQWIGISLDEIYRMKPSRDAFIDHRWPLVDLGMKRSDCLKWMEKNKFPKPPRSACTFCPFHNDAEWRRLKNEEPNEFASAVAFERELQIVKAKSDNMDGVPFLHNSLKFLSEVDFSTEEERGQLNMFNNECEGMCGV